MRGETSWNMATRAGRNIRRAAIGLVCLLALPCAADPIQQRLANGLVANADYHRGDNGQAVLLLHGFLATHQFPTIQHVASDLSDEGYTVLSPTLTLGINDRTTSLPCTALHLHTMARTIEELGWWVDWLAAQGNPNITLIGHSAGSIQVLAYSLEHPNPAVRQLILTSLVSLERLPEMAPAGTSASQAAQWLAAGQSPIATYDVSFCHGNFTAPPDVYLSYHAWSKQRIAQALRDTKIPTTVIMGANDSRFTGTGWMPMLRQYAPRLVVLKDANHFFDGMAEFALLDAVNAALHAQPRGSDGE